MKYIKKPDALHTLEVIEPLHVGRVDFDSTFYRPGLGIRLKWGIAPVQQWRTRNPDFSERKVGHVIAFRTVVPKQRASGRRRRG